MKLNYKRTICVGFAFFLISMFWQVYDTLVPKILTDKFGMEQVWSGLIMALDNVFALFLLPLFGALSDKLHSRHGRRTPFIFIGTLLAAVLLVTVAVPDAMQRTQLSEISGTEGAAYTQSLDALWERNPEIPSGQGSQKSPLSTLLSEEEFKAITVKTTDKEGREVTSDDYTKYVVTARQAVAREITAENPTPMIFLVVLLLFVLISMGTFRSPAVALMPDVTVKPLRSKANAVINLMGAAGGILVLGLGIVFGTGKVENAFMSYASFFLVVSALMLLSLLVFLLTVREPRFAAEMEEESRRLGLSEEAETKEGGLQGLTREQLKSLLLILGSVALWYMGYNAVTSKYSVYAGSVLGLDYNMTLIIAQAAAIVSYIPAGLLAARIGRRRSILVGVSLLFTAFLFAAFLRAGSSMLLVNLLFILAGIGWATINVNSFPMVVELSSAGDVGRYTGFYYTASMSAQIVTPVLSGFFLDIFDMTALFPYAALFVAGSFVTMLFVRHGDTCESEKKTILERLSADD